MTSGRRAILHSSEIVTDLPVPVAEPMTSRLRPSVLTKLLHPLGLADADIVSCLLFTAPAFTFGLEFHLQLFHPIEYLYLCDQSRTNFRNAERNCSCDSSTEPLPMTVTSDLASSTNFVSTMTFLSVYLGVRAYCEAPRPRRIALSHVKQMCRPLVALPILASQPRWQWSSPIRQQTEPWLPVSLLHSISLSRTSATQCLVT